MAESNKKFGFTEEQLQQFDDDFRRGKIAQIPKEALAVLGDYYIQLVETAVQMTKNGMTRNGDVCSVTHSMCHIYEDGLMSNELYRPIGDVLLDKLIEKAEQGYYSHANRSIDGYWQSAQDNPDVKKGLKAVLEKHPNYAFGQKYLAYINGATPEDEMKVVQRYLETPNMYFVTTTMVDIDGTLIQNGKANDVLIDSIMQYGYEDLAIYTGGDPVSQKEVLLETVAKKILEKSPLVKEEFSVGDIVNLYSQENEQNIASRKKLLYTIRNKFSHFVAAQAQKMDNCEEVYNLMAMKYWSESIVNFLNRLMSKGSDQIKIYPKQAFAQENICLADIVIDDTQPAAQGIKSLNMAILIPGESFDKIRLRKLGVPEERKITAEQAFGMYQQKRKTQMIAETEKLNKLEAAVEQKSTTLSEVCNNSKNTTR